MLIAFALFVGVWLLLVDTSSTAEWVGALIAAAIAVVAAALVYDSGTARLRFGLRSARGLFAQLARVPVDVWLLVRELARAIAGTHTQGRFHELALELPMSPRGNARRATIELVGSLAPNTIVLGVDERHVVVHQLVARHEERAGVGEIGA
ncbi:MAG TPA: hypothetical protein VHT27_13985 [Solirubrobacteraceae bacterium]|jgi:multisubunit Na+/H+ antiporter MnhE subunit|nr:hypothetical protein [Solirubrobacteraceae bacterium]